MKILRWISSNILKGQTKDKVIRGKLRVAPIEDKIERESSKIV